MQTRLVVCTEKKCESSEASYVSNALAVLIGNQLKANHNACVKK